MKKVSISILFIFLTFIFLFLRLYHLEESLTVGTDQGMHLLEIYNLFQAKKISLLGPVSSFKVYGRNFFFGPATYYLPMPFFALSGWNIFSVSYFTIILQFIAFLILYKSLHTRFSKSSVAMYYALIFTFSPIMVNYARFLWNPNLMASTSVLLLSVLLSLKKRKTGEKRPVLLAGLLLGLGMQFHYSYFLIIILTLIWLYVVRKFRLINFFFLTTGFVVGFLPIIIFELRHNFYNLQTFIQFVVVNLSEDKSMTYAPGYVPEYYALSLLPFVYLLASQLLVKLEKINRNFSILLIAGYITYSLLRVLPVPSEGLLSHPGWNYHGLRKAKEIIISEDKRKYNLVDLLTGDVRAMYLRALLTFDGKPPMTVDEYPDSHCLFLYTKEPIEKILKGSLWEMDVIKPLEVRKKWHLQNGIYLYLLEKSKKLPKLLNIFPSQFVLQ